MFLSLHNVGNSFFNILMKASYKENFTKEVIRDNVSTILIAASDTITTTINFAVFLLGNFPEIQERVYEELSEIYGMETPKSAPIKYDDLQYMRYLERVIKETMRIFSTVPLLGRQLTEDLKIGEVVLPKGADVILGLIRMNRDKKYWSNPLVFDPDRFLPERIKDYQSYYYVPFSDGRRNCIGIKFAMMSMKVILANLIRTFIFKVNRRTEINEVKFNFDPVLYTIEPLKVKLEKRYLK